MTQAFLSRCWGAAGALVLLTACSGKEPESPAFEAYDSAGVEVVVNHAPVGFDTPWVLSEEPVLRIGKGRDEEPYVFRNIAGATRLSDGSLVVMDWPSAEIRRFDSRGNHLLSFGGRGEGPGEFQTIRGGIQRRGDTLLFLDSDGTVARFNSEGKLLGEISAIGLRVRAEDAGGEWSDVSPDGTLWGARYPRVSEFPTGVVYRLPYLVVMADRERSKVRVVGEYLNAAEYEERIGYYPAFFAWAVPSRNPPGLLVGDNETFTIDLLDGTGHLVRQIRYPGGIRPADPELVAREREAWLGQYEAAAERGQSWDLARYRRLIEARPYPEVWPGFRGFLGDSEGLVWTLEYGPLDMVPGASRDPEDDYEALVFDPAGHLLGGVSFPARLEPLEIGTDYVLGVQVDDLGVNELVLYGLNRGSVWPSQRP